MIEDYIRRAVERAIHDTEHPRGMSIHDGKAKIEASYLRRMLVMLDAAPTPPVQQDDEAHSAAVSHLYECLGQWSAGISQGGELADLAPPSWLIDAINAATLPRQDDEALEVLRRIITAVEMPPGLRKIIRVSRLLDDARALLTKRGAA